MFFSLLNLVLHFVTTTPFITQAFSLSFSLSPESLHSLRFGQRYQRSGDTTQVSNQRIPIDVLSGERECIVCTETKPVAWFPALSVSKYCTHAPTTCLVCVGASIRSDLDNRLWNEIRCPECRGTMEYEDVQLYADDDTKTRYALEPTGD